MTFSVAYYIDNMMKTAYWVVLLGMVSCVNRGVVSVEETEEASLSEIAENVIAIPLETNGRCRVGEVDAVKRAGNDFFLLSNRTIYRFDRSGTFLSRMDSDKVGGVSSIRDFAVVPEREQVVAIDSFDHVLFYSYDGTLLEKKELTDKPWQNLLKIAYYDNRLWATVERCVASSSGRERRIEKWLYRLDTSFNLQQGTKLCEVELDRFHLSSHFAPELCVSKQGLYAYTASYEPEKLLADTLALIRDNRLEEILCTSIDNTPVPMLPLRVGERFLLASNRMQGNENDYIFCYDRVAHRAFRLKDGFTDNFFYTGKVRDLQALDIYNREFYYCKSGDVLFESFPQCEATNNPVLFLVHLKT